MKADLGELEDGVGEEFSWRLRKELNGVMEAVSGKRRLFMRFQDSCEKGMASNQLTSVKVYRIPVNEEAKVLMIY